MQELREDAWENCTLKTEDGQFTDIFQTPRCQKCFLNIAHVQPREVEN